MISKSLPFDEDILIHDIEFYRENEEDLLKNYKEFLPYLRAGLSLLEDKKYPNKYTICRKGLIKTFPFYESLLEFNQIDEKSKVILQILLKPCAKSLNKGKLLNNL